MAVSAIEGKPPKDDVVDKPLVVALNSNQGVKPRRDDLSGGNIEPVRREEINLPLLGVQAPFTRLVDTLKRVLDPKWIIGVEVVESRRGQHRMFAGFIH